MNRADSHGRHLAQQIGIALVAKALALALLFALFFSPGQRPTITPEQVGQAWFGPAEEGASR